MVSFYFVNLFAAVVVKMLLKSGETECHSDAFRDSLVRTPRKMRGGPFGVLFPVFTQSVSD